jgi:hypothetical protein
MLKTIGEFSDHESIIDSAKLIARWLYNHEKLHTMMKNAIGGNLVRWNATRFGTNYLFLESFLRRKDRFIQWMTTPQLQHSGYLVKPAAFRCSRFSLFLHRLRCVSAEFFRFSLIFTEFFKNRRDR